MNFIYPLVGVTILVTLVASQTDLTLEPKAKGVDVTDASLRKIKRAGVFPDDYSFMRRCALVESSFGDKEFTYRDNYFGGIWQLERSNFEKTKNSNLTSYHTAIFNNWGINWTSVTWNDCLKPLYSGLATRLYSLSLGVDVPIPGTVEEQADYWIRYYRLEGRTRTEYIDTVREHEKDPVCSGVADIVTVVDASGSITAPAFIQAKQFLAALVDLLLTASPNNTRVGMVRYGNAATKIFDLNNNLTRSAMNSTILSIQYPNGEFTNTPAGLNVAVDMFNNATPRVGVPQILMCFTDGNHSPQLGNLTAAIARVRNENITSIAVGIGNSIANNELLQIAQDNPGRVFQVTNYGSLYEFVYQMSTGTCEIPQNPEVGEDRTDVLVQLEFRFYVFRIPFGLGLTIRIEIGSGGCNGWFSRTEENPSSAINDGEIRNGWLYVPHRGGNGKQAGGEDEMVFVAVQGTQKSNEYTISTMEGNQVPNGSNKVQIASGLLTFFAMLFMSKLLC